jgi:hypothetical protein
MRWLCAALALFAGDVAADGKFYSDRIPPGIPYQRAMLEFDGAQQTLTLESKLEAKEGERFGWVVPVPSLPELASPGPADVDFRYSVLEGRSRARVVKGLEVVMGLLFVGFIGYWISKRRWGTAVGVVVFVGLLVGIATPSYMGVEVVQEQRVGPYDAKVIRGDSSRDIVAWLGENGFRFDESDRAAIDAYVSRKWLFVAARLDAGAKGARGAMVPPLMLTFATREAVYPLALTATAGQPVELLLYVIAPWRADASGRLPLHYAGADGGGRYLTKFRGVMTPEQMREDLILRSGESNAPYRRWEFRW